MWEECAPEDEAIKIIDFPDGISCWACGILPYNTYDSEKIEALCNHDHLLDRAHIIARSKGGEDLPSNLFLLFLKPHCRELWREIRKYVESLDFEPLCGTHIYSHKNL